jgi:hypothetical protein
MTADKELESLLQAITPDADDPNRVAASDWFDSHPEYLQMPSLREPPREFIQWFHSHFLPLHLGEKLAWQPSRGRWASWQIFSYFGSMPYGWFHHGRASIIAGHRVIVSSPHFLNERLSREVAAYLQERLGCPVTYIRRLRDGRESNRLVVWYDLAGDPPAPRPHPVELFCRTHIELAEGGFLRELDAYQRQAEWMSKNGYNPLDMPQLSRILQKLYPTSRRRKKDVDLAGYSQKMHVFEGLQWTAAHHDWVRMQEASAGACALPHTS